MRHLLLAAVATISLASAAHAAPAPAPTIEHFDTITSANYADTLSRDHTWMLQAHQSASETGQPVWLSRKNAFAVCGLWRVGQRRELMQRIVGAQEDMIAMVLSRGIYDLNSVSNMLDSPKEETEVSKSCRKILLGPNPAVVPLF